MSRNLTRSLTALGVGGLTSLTMMGTAQAVTCPVGTYPPGVTCTPFSITVTVANPGQTFTIHLTGFKAGSSVIIVIHGPATNLGTFTADSSGNVTAALTIPASFGSGTTTITASGIAPNGSARILSSTITIKAAGSGIPFTGFEVGAASLLGAGLLGAGTLAVVSGRRRKLVPSNA